MYHVTVVSPSRFSQRHPGEIHFAKTADTITKLRSDAILPLKDEHKEGMCYVPEHKAITVGEFSEEDAESLARIFGDNGWWLCWCDE